HFFASWRKQLGIPRWPVIVYDDEDPAGSDTTLWDSPGGLTLQEVAERFDVDDTTVRSAVIEEGGDIRPRGRRPQVSGR
ncbi:hypothetical protein PFZ49_14240, partial [Microbacterium lacticum]